MALTKEKKQEVIKELSELLAYSKMTVVTAYKGTPVKAMQELRRLGQENSTVFKVVKNRLVIKALAADDRFKEVDTSDLNGMLLYAFNAEDEAAPAQTIAKFAKSQPTLEFVGAINNEGDLIAADDVKVLSELPGKEQLRGMLVGTLAAPLSGFMNVLSGNVRGVLNVLSARAEQVG